MSKEPVPKQADEGVMTLGKRAHTGRLCKRGTESGYYVQIFEHQKPWSLQTHPWRLVEGPYFNVVLNELHGIGINIVPPACVQSNGHINLLPYGPDGMKIMNRDGCGGTVQRGQALQWKCGSLLHCEYKSKIGLVSADVMIIHVHSIDDCPVIENFVRALFRVTGDDDITEPSWKLGSMEQNECTYWKNHAAELSKQNEKLQLDTQAMQKQLEMYKDMHETIQKIATCSVCYEPAPVDDPCMLAACGHFTCKGCYIDYYKAIGTSIPRCTTCQQVAHKDTWQVMWCMNSVVAALEKAVPVERAVRPARAPRNVAARVWVIDP
jgi:hypothetical protein